MGALPSGLDWGDGLNGRPGTFTPDGVVQVQSANGATTVGNIQLEELPDAETEIAEQATLTKNFRTNYNDAITRLAGLPRGTVQTDSNGNMTKVLSVRVTRQPGGWAKLTVVSEGLSFDTPPDEFSIKPVELGVDILKHPRYFYTMQPSNFIPGGLNGLGVADTAQEQEVKQAIVRAVQTFRDSPTVPILPNLYNLMTGVVQDGVIAGFAKQNFQYLVPNPNYNPSYTATNTSQKPSTTPPAAATADGQPNAPMWIKAWSGTSSASINLALAAGQEVLSKLWRQEDTPYLVGLELRWKQFYWVNQALNLGGYVENPYLIPGSTYPTATPELPDYFYSTTYPADPSKTIFDKIPFFNPQCYSSTGQYGGNYKISWLRKADDVDYQRTWFGIERTWIGAPCGVWDEDLNSQKNRPNSPSLYNTSLFVS